MAVRFVTILSTAAATVGAALGNMHGQRCLAFPRLTSLYLRFFFINFTREYSAPFAGIWQPFPLPLDIFNSSTSFQTVRIYPLFLPLFLLFFKFAK